MKLAASILFALLLSPFTLLAHEAETEMAEAAKRFLATLSPEQNQKASFQLDDAERKNWHFIPRPRLGLPIKEMTQEQRLMAHALLSCGLSSQGLSKAFTVMSLEAVLAEIEKGQTGRPTRDPELYFFSIFGTPSLEKPWAWRVEGHHLSLNFTCSTSGSALTPTFFGTNPGEVRNGPRSGLRVLGREEDLGRRLAKSLNTEQRKQAVLSEQAPKDILNDPKREGYTEPEGIELRALDAEQRKMLEDIVREYLGRHRRELQSKEWERIHAADWESVRFQWAGGMEPGQGHYYRIQGKTFILEYDNTQNEGNHAHSLWRDRDRDFGVDQLKEHYSQSHQK